MTKIIYVVTEGEYSDYHIVTMFSEQDAAEAFVKRRLARPHQSSPSRYPDRPPPMLSCRYGDTRIEEYPLDVARETRKDGMSKYIVQMDRDGNSAETLEEFSEREHLETLRHASVSYADDSTLIISHWLRHTVWATSCEQAIKIANEKRSQILATNQWDSLKKC